MSGEGYQAVQEGLFERRRLVYTRLQVKNQIGVLKNIYSFYRYLLVHTGLGRLPDGTIDADSEFWITHTEKKPYLRRLLKGPPPNSDLLEHLFRGFTVDGSIAYAPRNDYGEQRGQDGGAKETDRRAKENLEATPRSTSSKWSWASTSTTVLSPVKKSKGPMVKIVWDIASTFKESASISARMMAKRPTDKEAFSIARCQELAFPCGVERTVEAVYAMSKLFASQYQREFFCVPELTPDLRLR